MVHTNNNYFLKGMYVNLELNVGTACCMYNALVQGVVIPNTHVGECSNFERKAMRVI